MKKKAKFTLKTQFVKIDELRDERKVVVCAVQPGPSSISFRGKQVYISEEMIADLVPLIQENTIMFSNHKDRDERAFHLDTVSWIVPESVRLAKEGEFDGIVKGSLICEVKFSNNPNTKWMYDDLLDDPRRFELSIASIVIYEFKKIDGVEYAYARTIVAHLSTDWVDYGAAGGEVLAASADKSEMSKERIMEKYDVSGKLKAKIDEVGLEEAVLANFKIEDNINREIVYKLGNHLLDFTMDLLYWSSLSFEEMEAEIDEAIETVFNMLKDMDFMAMFGVTKEARDAEVDLKAMVKFIQTKFDDNKSVALNDVITTVWGVDAENWGSGILLENKTKLTEQRTEEEEHLDKETLLKVLKTDIMDDERKEILMELQKLNGTEDQLATLQAENETLKTEKDTLNTENLELKAEKDAFEAEKAFDAEILELKEELKVEKIEKSVMKALRLLESKEDRLDLLKSMNAGNSSLIMLNAGLEPPSEETLIKSATDLAMAKIEN